MDPLDAPRHIFRSPASPNLQIQTTLMLSWITGLGCVKIKVMLLCFQNFWVYFQESRLFWTNNYSTLNVARTRGGLFQAKHLLILGLVLQDQDFNGHLMYTEWVK